MIHQLVVNLVLKKALTACPANRPEWIRFSKRSFAGSFRPALTIGFCGTSTRDPTLFRNCPKHLEVVFFQQKNNTHDLQTAGHSFPISCVKFRITAPPRKDCSDPSDLGRPVPGPQWWVVEHDLKTIENLSEKKETLHLGSFLVNDQDIGAMSYVMQD